MRKLYVPILVSQRDHSDLYLRDFKKLGVYNLFLAVGDRMMLLDDERYQLCLDLIKKCLDKYTNQGYECGVWISTLGFGASLEGYGEDVKKLTQIRSVDGREAGDALCPTDERFVARVERTVQDLVCNGARMIMLDDELCLSVRPGLGCACDNHLAEFSRLMGENIELQGLPELLFTGESNKYRRTWIDMQGDTLRNFCRRLRAAVDAIDPTVRMGFCAGYTSWDVEGVDAIELTHILAGNTKPFLRFTSAPYWYYAQRFGQTPMPTFIEFARMQAEWVKDEDIEVFTECDTFPHDRYHTPVSHIECFDVGTMLTKNIGTLKYVYHYPTHPDSERGYIDRHFASMPVYEDLQREFHSRPEVGVRVYEEMHKFKDSTLPQKFDVANAKIYQRWIMAKYSLSEAQMMLSVNAIPTVYSGSGLCGIAFGQNAKYITDDAFEKGLILDVSAAEILQARGIDVGLRSVKPLSMGPLEDFSDGSYPVPVTWATDLCELECDREAQVISHFVDGNASKSDLRRVPSAYLYENKDGQRFLVYAFRSEKQPPTSGMYWNYHRGEQISKAIPWLGGEELAVNCFDHPHVYCRCNADDSSVAAAYFNCSVDHIEKTEVKFARDITNVNIIGGKGRQLDSRTVEIEDIRSFGYVAIVADYVK